MNKTLIFVGILVILAFAGGYYVKGITGNVVSSDLPYSYTKAVCNEGNCLDVYVECSSKGIYMTPLTDYSRINTTRFNITNEVAC